MYVLWSFEYNLCPSKALIDTYTDVKLNIKAYAQDAHSKETQCTLLCTIAIERQL